MNQLNQLKPLLFNLGGILMLSFFLSFTGYSQKIEYGLSLGAMTYTGEIVPTYTIAANLPSGSIFIKRNYGYASALRYNFSVGYISVKDADYSRDIFSRNRNASLDVSLLELSLLYEYNFLDFRNPKERTYLSPYMIGGIGGVFTSPSPGKAISSNNFQFILPIGAGVKYRINRKVTLAFEVIIKATFTDQLDNITNENQDIKTYNFGDPHHNDTYYFVGFRLGYSIWRVDCPFDAY